MEKGGEVGVMCRCTDLVPCLPQRRNEGNIGLRNALFVIARSIRFINILKRLFHDLRVDSRQPSYSACPVGTLTELLLVSLKAATLVIIDTCLSSP